MEHINYKKGIESERTSVSTMLTRALCIILAEKALGKVKFHTKVLSSVQQCMMIQKLSYKSFIVCIRLKVFNWAFIHMSFEPRREKTGFLYMRKTKTQISFAVTAKLISAFVFAIRIVQSLYYLHPKFQASGHLLWLYRPVCVGPSRKPRRPVFSQRGSFWSHGSLIFSSCLLTLR